MSRPVLAAPFGALSPPAAAFAALAAPFIAVTAPCGALAALAGVAAALAPGTATAREIPSVTADAAACEGELRVDERFANGARWSLCIESRVRENLVLKHVTYTPPGGAPLPVLASASLAQLHVAYDDNDVTYNDVTQYGLGGGYLLELSAEDCPDGTRLEVRTRPAICLWRTATGDGFRAADRAVERESVNLFSVSQVGAYAYVQSWTLRDDGAIEPSIGATGALQRGSESTDAPFGRVLDGDPATLWLSHTHNYHWRLDFDLGEYADDDVVTETRFVPGADGRRRHERERFEVEVARRIEPASMQAWHVWEGQDGDGEPGPRGYRIEPLRQGHRFERTEIEPHTAFDVFVTVARDCERFASQNARYEPDCLDDVLQYADAEPLAGEDLVLWHRVGFHHVPRNEDQRHMHAHWDGFAIEPVDVHRANPAIETRGNTPPDLAALGTRRSVRGETVEGYLAARDADGDALSWSAENLPPGVRLEPDGRLDGRLESSGAWRVAVRVDDGRAVTAGDFHWRVDPPPAARERGGLGRLDAASLLIGSVALWLRRRRRRDRRRRARLDRGPGVRTSPTRPARRADLVAGPCASVVASHRDPTVERPIRGTARPESGSAGA